MIGQARSVRLPFMLLSVSVSHRTAGFDLLERLSGVEHPAAAMLGEDIRGAVVVSTCNRVEAYLDVTTELNAQAADAVLRRIAETAGVPAEELAAQAVIDAGQEALRHLFAVTAGLESLAVGEDEIAGQVRRAYDTARAGGSTTPELDRAFQRAAKVSREVRAAADLGHHGRSLVQFALGLASHRVTDWRAARVLVVGTGNYAATTIQALRGLGVADLTVYSATGRADAFAERYAIRPAHDLGAALAAAEVVVTCTRAYTVTAEHVPGDGARRLVIDLGLPRNVAAEVARLPGIELLDLEIIAAHTGVPELVTEQDARTLVRDAAGRFVAEQLAAPAVVALRRHVFDALDGEIARAEARAGSPEAAAETVEALRHLAGVLLHTPSERARALAADGRVADFEAALTMLFGIETAEAASVAPLPLSAPPEASQAAGA